MRLRRRLMLLPRTMVVVWAATHPPLTMRVMVVMQPMVSAALALTSKTNLPAAFAVAAPSMRNKPHL